MYSQINSCSKPSMLPAVVKNSQESRSKVSYISSLSASNAPIYLKISIHYQLSGTYHQSLTIKYKISKNLRSNSFGNLLNPCSVASFSLIEGILLLAGLSNLLGQQRVCMYSSSSLYVSISFVSSVSCLLLLRWNSFLTFYLTLTFSTTS